MPEPFVVWDNKFNVNIAEIDRQHRGLIDFTNELFEACRTAETKEAFRTTIHKSVQYVKTHFAYEEKLMIDYRYPGYGAHKLEHEEFVRQILKEVGDFEAGRPFVANAFVRFLKDWYLKHIAISDKKYSKFFNDRGVH